MTSNVIVQQINGGPTGAKNAIINGNFGINQRGVSGTVTLAAGAYGHDRWKAGASGCTYTFATSENVTTITISAGSLIQVVEGLNLLTDTYILSWQGTAQGKIGAGSYGNSGVTGSVTGGSNLNIEFGTGTVSKVQLERGSVATPFEFRSIGQELALCQRYFEAWTGEGYNGVASGGCVATNGVDAIYQFLVQKRASVTATISTASDFYISDGNWGSPRTCNSVGFLYMTNKNVFIQARSGTSNLTLGQSGIFGSNNTVNARINFSAEL